MKYIINIPFCNRASRSHPCRTIPNALIGLVALAILGCGGPDPGLVERIDRQEAELREKNNRISELEQRLSSSNARTSKPSTPPMADVEAKLARGAMQLRRDVESRFGAGSVTDFKMSEVEKLDFDKPYNASITLVISSSDGNARTVTTRAVGDRSGEWLLPSVDEIVQQLEATPISSAPSPQRKSPEREVPRDVMGAGQTVVIEWNDTPKQRRAPSRPERGVTQVPPKLPLKSRSPSVPQAVMPADRDVIIDFGD